MAILRPFLTSLTANLSQRYNPYSQQAVEEVRIKYMGYTSLTQYMPMELDFLTHLTMLIFTFIYSQN